MVTYHSAQTTLSRYESLQVAALLLTATRLLQTLDDYEEGTWTPVIEGASSAGTGTYTMQYGEYVKIGRAVTIHMRIDWTAHTGSGNMQISGLPLTGLAVIAAQIFTHLLCIHPELILAQTLPLRLYNLGRHYCNKFSWFC